MKREHIYKGHKIVTYVSGNGWWVIYNVLGHRVGSEYESMYKAVMFIDSIA
jgi:hypothetical protein